MQNVWEESSHDSFRDVLYNTTKLMIALGPQAEALLKVRRKPGSFCDFFSVPTEGRKKASFVIVEEALRFPFSRDLSLLSTRAVSVTF